MNPGGTFKSRGAAVGVSRAKELGVTKLAMPTNGNAGAAWSIYCAKAGIEAYIVMPVDAPAITRSEFWNNASTMHLVLQFQKLWAIFWCLRHFIKRMVVPFLLRIKIYFIIKLSWRNRKACLFVQKVRLH